MERTGRAGWVGCNLDLHRIAPEARIDLVRTIGPQGSAAVPAASLNPSAGRRDACATVIAPPEEVRARYTRLKPIREIKTAQRGWTLDVLNAIRRLGKTEFTTADAYAFTRELEKLHPDNRHVRDKIRQQLQVLRDAGLLVHVERGVWHLP